MNKSIRWVWLNTSVHADTIYNIRATRSKASCSVAYLGLGIAVQPAHICNRREQENVITRLLRDGQHAYE